MLKTKMGERFWCVTQPDHAAVSGFLAAHWGRGHFARPGYFGDAADCEALRAEVVMAAAQHDNGWWQWEAVPKLNPHDGLPLGLTDPQQSHNEGIERWRTGIKRFSDSHPYVDLLISFHAYWLYAPRCEAEVDPAFGHPLYLRGLPPRLMGKKLVAAEVFLAELKSIQANLIRHLGDDPDTADWVQPEQLQPHIRLVQLLDGLSLGLCSSLIVGDDGQSRGPGRQAFTLVDVPRRTWDDRVSIDVTPMEERRIRLDPYPFDVDPLGVVVPVRILPALEEPEAYFPSSWHAVAPELVRFELCSQ